MKTNHINHVVLYAKNFYRHTGDIVKDMSRIMQLDGHKFWDLKTPEKVWKAMQKDYLKWVDSITDTDHLNAETLRNDADHSVAWADGYEGKIWAILIKYNCYIPMTSKVIGYPKYDQYHMPQFNIKEHLFKQGQSYEEWNKAAKEFLDQPQVKSFDEYMNNLMDEYPFEDVAKVFNKIGDSVTPEELEDEMWENYEKFVNEHIQEDNETLADGYFEVYSKHFVYRFATTKYAVDINVYASYDHKQYIVNDIISHETISKFAELIGNDDDFIKNRIKISEYNNEIFDYGYHNIEKNDYDDIQNSIKSVITDFNDDLLWEDLVKEKMSNLSTFHFIFNVKEENENSIMDVYFVNVFNCSIKENNLRNTQSLFISSKCY